MNLDHLLSPGGRGAPVRGDPLDDPVVELVRGKDALSWRHLCEGSLIFGSTGSGKTSGSGRVFRDGILRAGAGGIVLCVKDETADWVAALKAIGRERDLILFGPAHDRAFNPFEHERTRAGPGGGQVENIVALIGELEAVTEPGSRPDSSDAYFRLAARDCARMSVLLLILADAPVTVANLYDLLATAPLGPSQAADPNWRRESFTAQLLSQAFARETPETRQSVRRVKTYFLSRYAGMPDKTRACVADGLIARLSVLSSGPLERLFGGAVNWTPALAAAGKVTVVDVPMLEYGETGRLTNVLMKASFMRDVQRRAVRPETRPVFLWSDEYHYQMSPGDQLFLTTARSSRCAAVFLTQSLSNLTAALGGGKEAEPVVASLLGNLRTKVIHSVEERETCEYLAHLIGYEHRMLTGLTVPTGSPADRAAGGQLPSASLNQHREFRVEPSDFQSLKTGGPPHDGIVEGVVFRGGQKFSNHQTFIKVAFDQRTGKAI